MLLLSHWALSQNYAVYPVQFDQFYRQYSLINPAATGLQAKLKISAGHKLIASIFEGVNTSFTGGEYQLPSDSGSASHAIGLNLMNSHEGPYFNRGRFMAQYAFHGLLSEQWRFSAGVMAGFLNHSYKATDVYPARSVTRPLLDLGILAHRKNFLFGMGYHQVIKSSLSPLEPNQEVIPFGSLCVDYKIPIGPRVYLNPASTCRIGSDLFNWDMAMLWNIQDLISLGGHYKWKKGYALSGSIDTGDRSSSGFSLSVLYYIPLAIQGNLRPQTLEFVCVFRYGKNNRM